MKNSLIPIVIGIQILIIALFATAVEKNKTVIIEVISQMELDDSQSLKSDERISELIDQDKYDEALVVAKENLDKAKKSMQENDDLVFAYTDMANVYYYQDKYNESITAYEQALTIYQKNHPKDDHTTAQLLREIANVYYYQDDYEKSIVYYTKNIALLKMLKADITSSLDELANVYDSNDDYENVIRTYKEVLALRIKKDGESDAMSISTMHSLSKAYINADEYDQAEAIIRKILALESAAEVKNEKSIASAYNSLGDVFYFQDRFDEAEKEFLKALTLREKIYKSEPNSLIITTLNNLGYTYLEQKKNSMSEEYYRKSITMNEALYGKESTEVGDSFEMLASLYKKMKEYNKAEMMYKQQLSIYRHHYPEDHESIQEVLQDLEDLRD